MNLQKFCDAWVVEHTFAINHSLKNNYLEKVKNPCTRHVFHLKSFIKKNCVEKQTS